MKRILQFVACFLLFLGTAESFAQPIPQTPVDPTVRVGKLPNGLTYYIRHNNWPENRADFYIAQRVGSINEEESQRGLAHFLEHMCFNGTKNFPGDKLIHYLEGLGVKFGENLNAYTAVDETVYNICNVPTGRVSALDSCLLILHDWSHDLTLDPKEIDKERGVIHGEWRMRTGAQYRMLEKCAPLLYPNSRYGQRLPIGLMSVVDHFKYKELTDYYHKWYYPANQGIIVVGDIDVDRTEQKIKEMFSSIPAPKNPAKRIYYPVPDNNNIICTVQKDKEQPTLSVELMFKHEAFPDSLKTSIYYLIHRYLEQAATSMLNSRFEELQKKPDAPFTEAGAYNGDYIIAQTKEALDFSASCKDGKAEDCIKALTREAFRAYKYGFTATEFNRFAADYLSSIESRYKNRDKETNNTLVNVYVKNFLDNEPRPSIEQYYQLISKIIPQIGVDKVNQVYREMISPSDTNVVIVSFCPDKQGVKIPTEASLINAFHEAKKEDIQPYVDNVKTGPLLDKEPVAGKIVKETTLPQFDTKVWTLSNGVQVYLKKTDFSKDEVRVIGVGPGGDSQYGNTDIPDIKMLNPVIGITGVGKFTNTELQKALAGKQISVSASVNMKSENVSVNTTPGDLRSAMQIMYLTLTEPKRDDDAFNSLMVATKTELENSAVDPQTAFSDSLQQTIYAHHPRSKRLTVDMLKHVSYDKILDIYKDRFKDVSDFKFFIIGNFNEDSVRLYTQEYIASLPAAGRIEKPKDTGLATTKGKVQNFFEQKMETPQSTAFVLWQGNCPWTVKNELIADITGQILTKIYLKEIREDKGWAYSAGSQGSLGPTSTGIGKPEFRIYGYCPVKPENSKDAMKVMINEMNNIATKGVDATQLNQVKEYMAKKAAEDFKKNGYWINILAIYAFYNMDENTNLVKTIQSITTKDIQDFVKNYVVNKANRVEVIMNPDAASLKKMPSVTKK